MPEIVDDDDDDSSTDSEATDSDDAAWMVDLDFPTDDELCEELPHGDPRLVVPCIGVANPATQGPMFPYGALPGASANPLLPYHPDSQFISEEQCTEEERERLVNFILTRDQDRNHLCNLLYTEHNYMNDAKKGYKTMRHNHRPTEAILRRLRRHERRIANFRQSIYNIIQDEREMMVYVLAIVNGIAYRALHPDQSFVIYINRHFPIIQQCQPRHHFQHFHAWADPNLADGGGPPLPTPAPTTPTPTHDRHPRNVPEYFTYQNKTFYKFPIVFVNSIHEFLFQSNGESKIMVIPSPNHPADFEILKTSLHEIYLIYKTTLQSFYYSKFYLKLINDLDYHMTFLEKLLNKDVAKISKKTLLIYKIKTFVKDQMNQNYRWWKNPTESLESVIQLISKEIDLLVGNSINFDAATPPLTAPPPIHTDL